MTILGREQEREQLGAVLTACRAGRGGSVVLRGEAGVGKTALLDLLAAEADGFRVLRLAGIESEADLSFAVLHRLLRPYLDGLDHLAAPQRDAILAAFGIGDDAVADPLLVGLGCLEVLSIVAADEPVLCIVDDAQWSDGESAVALGSVARRLHASRIAIVFALQEPVGSVQSVRALDDLAALHIGDLPPAAARSLLAAVVPGHVDDATATWVLSQTRGNPLAIVDVAVALRADGRAAPGPGPLPLSRRLEDRFRRQVRSLPPDTQTLLVVAAADPTGDPSVLWRACRRLGVAPGAADAAEAAHVLSTRPVVRFRHPLVRSAVYHGAPPSEQRRAHEAIAAVTDPAVDQEWWAWHRSAAAVGRDDAVARDLVVAAAGARERGGYARAATFLARAADLSDDPPWRFATQLAAAQADAIAGATARAERLLDESVPHLGDPLTQARALRLRANLTLAVGGADDVPRPHLDAAYALAPLHRRMAREAILEATTATRLLGRSGDPDAAHAVGRAALDIPAASDDVTTGDVLLDGLAARALDGDAAAFHHLRSGVDALTADDCPSEDLFRWGLYGGYAAGALGDHGALHQLMSRFLAVCRNRGATTMQIPALHTLTFVDVVRGQLRDAETSVAAAHAVLGDPAHLGDLGDALLMCHRGPEDAALALAEAVAARAEEASQAWVRPYVDWGLGVLHLASGRYQAAVERLQAARWDDSYLLVAVVPADLVEAAVRAGRRPDAGAALERLASWAGAVHTPLARGQLARARAILADDDAAEALHLEALDELGAAATPALVARSQLVYGEWLRRRKRRRDAREQLGAAVEAFERIGARPFAERARAELEATGESGRGRPAGAPDHLTPQERQVTRLAARGATNQEIAAQLHISTSTVEHHLRRVFRKLGVRSRRDLARTPFALD